MAQLHNELDCFGKIYSCSPEQAKNCKCVCDCKSISDVRREQKIVREERFRESLLRRGYRGV